MKRKVINPLTTHLSWLLMSCLFLIISVMGFTASVEGSGFGENLLVNPSFEELEEGIPVTWNAQWTRGNVTASPEAARTGNIGIRIDGSTLHQNLDVESNEIYEFSGWLKCLSDRQVQLKVEFFKDSIDAAGYLGGIRHFADMGEEWELTRMTVTTPSNANKVQAFLIMSGDTGACYFDDASFRQSPAAPGVNVLTNDIFYDHDDDQGAITGTIAPDDHVYNDKVVNVRIYPQDGGDAVVHEQVNLVTPEFQFDFDPRLMSLQEPYTVEVTLNDQQGVELYSATHTIYRWERATSLRKDGTLIVDGKPFFPIVGYHVPLDDYQYVSDTVNTVQTVDRRRSGEGMGIERDKEFIQEQLDTAHEYGLKVILPLYADISNMKGPKGTEYIKEMVNEFKGHEALLAYYLSDEPDLRNTPTDELAEYYKAIRSVDPVKPTYMVVASPAEYERYGRVTDILAPDIYPLPSGITPVGRGIGQATNLFPGKPIWSVLQTFHWPNDPQNRWPYLPNITEVRNMAYQSLLEGAKGLGYYSFTDFPVDPSWQLMESTLYPGLVKFNEKEIPHFENFLLSGQQIGSYKDEAVQWGLWEKDDELYAAIINLTEEPQTATVSLPGSGYFVETLAPEYRQSSTFDNELNIELSELESTLIVFKPFTSSHKMKELVGQLVDEGAFANEGAVRALTMHLTSVEYFEKQGTKEKVVQHLRGFHQLLDQQEVNGLISREAYQMLKADTEALSQQMAESLLRMHVHPVDAIPGEPVRIKVQLENLGEVSIQDPILNVHWPKAFGLSPEEKTVSTLNPGQSTEVFIEVDVPEGTLLGEYSISTGVQFNYRDVDMSYTREGYMNVLPLTEAKLNTAEIIANAPGEYPVSFTLKNNSAQSIDVTLEGIVPEGIELVMDSPVPLNAGQIVEVAGILQISDGIPENAYQIIIEALVDGKRYHELPVTVNFTRNLLRNPGFEVDENNDFVPDGWNLRDAEWVQDEIHGGQYAATLLTEYEVDWNIFSTTGFIPVTPDATYRLSAWVKVGSPEGRVNIGVREVDVSHATVEYKFKLIRNNSDWAHYEMEFTPTADTRFMQVYVDNGNNSAQSWFDDFRLEEVSGAES